MNFRDAAACGVYANALELDSGAIIDITMKHVGSLLMARPLALGGDLTLCSPLVRCELASVVSRSIGIIGRALNEKAGIHGCNVYRSSSYSGEIRQWWRGVYLV